MVAFSTTGTGAATAPGSASDRGQTFAVNASAVSANGTWKLRVNDNASADTGKIDD